MPPPESMHTRDEIRIGAPLGLCLDAAREIERWPDLLPHYRDVRFLRRDGPGAGRVHMAAYRDFGPLRYPIWWVSEMETDEAEHVVRYRHVEGITTGMDVEWRLEAGGGATRVVIVHDWAGPRWPLIGGIAARAVIGPHFIRIVAQRTLEGLRKSLEDGAPR